MFFLLRNNFIMLWKDVFKVSTYPDSFSTLEHERISLLPFFSSHCQLQALPWQNSCLASSGQVVNTPTNSCFLASPLTRRCGPQCCDLFLRGQTLARGAPQAHLHLHAPQSAASPVALQNQCVWNWNWHIASYTFPIPWCGSAILIIPHTGNLRHVWISLSSCI